MCQSANKPQSIRAEAPCSTVREHMAEAVRDDHVTPDTHHNETRDADARTLLRFIRVVQHTLRMSLKKQVGSLCYA